MTFDRNQAVEKETMKAKMIAFLLEHANPSIKMRVKQEVLHTCTSGEVKAYQKQIMSEPIVQKIISLQQENGWIGNGLHGSFDSQEGATKYLAEKGMDRNSHVMQRAMDAFATTPLDHPYYTSTGRILDVYQYPTVGNNLIRAACVARAGYDDMIDIEPLIQLSLDSFRRVLEVDSILDVSHIAQGNRRVFNAYEKWPCRYHLDILAHTDCWKNERNIKMLADSFTKIMKNDRPELIGLKADVWVGHILGACECFPSQGFSLKRIEQKTGNSYFHMEYIEWLARCGVIPYISVMRDIVHEITCAVDANGVCQTYPGEFMFRKWGPYAGLQLEVDWKSRLRRACDVTFRALMILHYADHAN